MSLIPHAPIHGWLKRAMLVVEDTHGRGYMVSWPIVGENEGEFTIQTAIQNQHPYRRVIDACIDGTADIKMVWNIDDLFNNFDSQPPVERRLRAGLDELTAGVREEPPT